MAYRVNLTARAGRDLAQLFEDIHARDSSAALDWYRGLKQAILSLRVQSQRCAVTPEDNRLRHLLYGNRLRIYRVIYRVRKDPKQVDVLHIRHGARRPRKSGRHP